MEERRLNTTGFNREEDEEIELKLRPVSFDGYIGQTKVKENMKVFIQAALGRGETLDHVLLYGHRVWAKLHYRQ